MALITGARRAYVCAHSYVCSAIDLFVVPFPRRGRLTNSNATARPAVGIRDFVFTIL